MQAVLEKGVKMTERKIIEHDLLCLPASEIDENIERAIKDGWQPFGGVCVAWEPLAKEFYYAQAMVKYESK